MAVNIINLRKMDSVASQMVQRLKEIGHPVFKSISALSRGILKGKMEERPYTSISILRTQNFYSQPFTQKISSVSTEQSQTGVKSSVEHHVRKKMFQTSLHPKNMKRY